MSPDLGRRLGAEFAGTAFLLAIVIGSGIMGDRLSGGSVGLALLANAVATGAGLVVLITIFGPVSGAHFNPAVTLVFAMRREIEIRPAAAYVAAQIAGAVIGVWAAHLMFGEALLQVSLRERAGPAQGLSEAIATFGLIIAILGCVGRRPDAVPALVGLYITAAYWFTASTSFANPAVTLARMFSDTFAGITPASAPLFMVCQVAGAVAATGFAAWMWPARPSAVS